MKHFFTHLGEYRKGIAAFIGTVATWGIASFEDNLVTNVEWFALLAGIGAVVSVVKTENDEFTGDL